MPYTRQQKKLLLFGFVRLNYDDYIPTDIILLLLEWISTILYVTIEGDLMKKFWSDEKSNNKQYSIDLVDGISLGCTLTRDEHEISWDLKAISPINLSSVQVYIESGCLEIDNAVYKQTRSLTLSYTQTHFITPVPLCRDKDELTFYVDIESIWYNLEKEDGQKEKFSKYTLESPLYNSHIEYRWILEGDELTKFKNCIPGQWVFSPNFMNGCIGIFCTPKGDAVSTMRLRPRSLVMGIEFYKIPNKVASMHATTTFKTNICDDDGKEIECLSRGYYIYNCSTSHVDKNFTLNMFEKIKDKLEIVVIIDILEVRVPTSTLDKSQWHKYGVVEVNK